MESRSRRACWTMLESDEWSRSYTAGKRGDTLHGNPPGTPDVLIVPVASRDGAVEALKQIAEQGEACPTDSPDSPSHFARFLGIFKELRDLLNDEC